MGTSCPLSASQWWPAWRLRGRVAPGCGCALFPGANTPLSQAVPSGECWGAHRGLPGLPGEGGGHCPGLAAPELVQPGSRGRRGLAEADASDGSAEAGRTHGGSPAAADRWTGPRSPEPLVPASNRDRRGGGSARARHPPAGSAKSPGWETGLGQVGSSAGRSRWGRRRGRGC